MMPPERVDRKLQLAVLLLALPAGVQLGAMASLRLFGQLQGSVVLGGALLVWLAVAVLQRASFGHGRETAFVWLTASGVVVACMLLTHALDDFSHDGQQYHQQAIVALIEGWNPLGQAEYEGAHALWVNSYTKGIWLFSAAMFAMTGSLELGKSFNLLVAVGAWLLCAQLFQRALGLSRTASWVLATAFAFSPILGSQWPTFYNDSVVGSLLLVMGVAALLLLRDPNAHRLALVIWALAIFLIATVKSSGMAYAGLVIIAFVAGAWVLARRRVALQLGGAAALAGLLVLMTVGYNPYVTNTLRHGHPLYPLRGGNADIITGTASADFLARSRIEQLLLSTFSRSQSTVASDQQSADDQIRLKAPGAVYRSELELFMSRADARIGGFGPWFSLGLVLSAMCVVMTLVLGRLTRREILGLLALPSLLLALTLAFPEPWWARYVPQLWFLPLSIAAAALVLRGANLWISLSAWVVVAVLLVNTMTVTSLFAMRTVAKQLDFSTQVASLRAISTGAGPLPIAVGFTPSTIHRLRELGVATTPAPPAFNCPTNRAVLYTGAVVCLPPEQMRAYAEDSPWVLKVKSALRRGTSSD